MPKLYEYMGIVIKFYSHDHDPIHVHARYGNNEMRVELFEENGLIYDMEYTAVKGKFTPAKLKDLKIFINENKSAILFAWKQTFEQHVKLKPLKITKKIR
jgi:hypothetical protein